jgi:hypothetical protein
MLEDLTPTTQARPCAVNTLMSKLEKKDQEILTAALANPDWKSKALARELSSRGLLISDHPIGRHRKGECSCSKI